MAYSARVEVIGFVLVVDELLPQCLCDALRDAAVLLAPHEQGVDDATAVVHRDVAQVMDGAGLDVDLDHGDVGAEGEGGAVLRGVERGGQGPVAVVATGRACASSAQLSARAGTPATPTRPSSPTTMSSTSASSSRAARRRARSTTAPAAVYTAVPPICSDREPPVPPPRGTTSVSDWR
jgi:hypothetical protein